MVETLPYTYTSADEMVAIISQLGIDLRVDDSTDILQLPPVINEATDTINLYLYYRYEDHDLADNTIIRRWCSFIAVRLLCIRRANPIPEAIETHYQEIIGWLEKCKTGQFPIPRLPTRLDFAPALSNFKINDRFKVNKIRVQPSISTGGASSRQDPDTLQPYP